MATLAEFITIIGFELKIEKSAIGTANTFLGITDYFQQHSNQMSLAISLPRDKAYRWAKLISSVIQEKLIAHATLESLIGRLSFAQTAIFGRFARAMLKPLYAKLYSNRYLPNVSPALERNLRWRPAALLSLTPRLDTQSMTCPDWVIYTDAAFEPGPNGAHIAAVFFQILGGPWGAKQIYF